MRIPIRGQLAGLLLLSTLLGLAVISLATWIVVRDFVLTVRASRLTMTAQLKAGQLTSSLDLMQTAGNFVSTRVLVQRALTRYNVNGNNTDENWTSAVADLEAAIGGDGSLGQMLLMQAMVFPINGSGPAGPYSLMNVTAPMAETIQLPYTYTNGTPIMLGANDSDAQAFGFPPALYPNLTYSTAPYNSTFQIPQATYAGDTLTAGSNLILGPWSVNSTYSLMSMTMPIINNTSAVDILGWLTVVMDATLVTDIVRAADGPYEFGDPMIVGAANKANVFPASVAKAPANAIPDFPVNYVIPLNASLAGLHPNEVMGAADPPFNASQFDVLFTALAAAKTPGADKFGADLWANNENGRQVSVGWAIPSTNLVDWIVLVELSRSEVWAPIVLLRNIILACLFSTLGFMIIVAVPLAHFASLPILRLRHATSRSVAPPGSASRSSIYSYSSNDENADGSAAVTSGIDAELARKEGFVQSIKRWRHRSERGARNRSEERRKREFRIPQRVKERRTFIHDELSDLTTTFNEMSDELMMQYSRLEERVQQRTAELELSKKAAEAANESKTLFIANISHELKTPLNGILGMCAVCMQEDDPIRLKRSLGIIYKSGDLLLNLLTDLLTFSKNEVGQHLTLDEKEFRLKDISSQTLAIFEKQASEGKIDLRVDYEGVSTLLNDGLETSEFGPPGTGRVRDMILWGDLHRVLQVVINLVSNSLKFTPPGGSVTLILRCLGETPTTEVGSRSSSMNSRRTRRISSRNKAGSETTTPSVRFSTDGDKGAAGTYGRGNSSTRMSAFDRASSPPPAGRFLNFEFEVVDTGPGIAEKLQKQIFEPFVQGDLRLSKKFGGTGLGLSICSQLAKLMQGDIRVRSAEGQGATFTMKIPLKHTKSRADSTASSANDFAIDAPSRSGSIDATHEIRPTARAENPASSGATTKHLAPTAGGEASHLTAKTSKTSMAEGLGNDPQPRLVGLSNPFFAASQPMESPNSQPGAMVKITADAARCVGGKIRVLVAEDNRINQEVVLRMLKLEDIYDVTVAKDGQEALDLVKESMRTPGALPYNLIFMDVQMPNVDGLESTRLIREIGYEAPIVALTAFAEESNIKDCLDSGMNYFLSKPIRRPQLKKVLKTYCSAIPEENEDSTPSPSSPASVPAGNSPKLTAGVRNGAGLQPAPVSPATTSPASSLPTPLSDELATPGSSLGQPTPSTSSSGGPTPFTADDEEKRLISPPSSSSRS